MRRLLAFTLHTTSAGVMAWGWLSFMRETAGSLIRGQKGGYFQFLTNHGLMFAWLYMVVSLFCDLLPSVAIGARHLKKTLLLISMPMSFVISSIYWSLLLFLPQLIVPPTAIKVPLVIDLALHVWPLVTLLFDFFVFEPKFPKTYVRKAAPTALFVFSIWYASFVEYCASFNGFFPYPFLTHSPFPVRVLIYGSAMGIAMGCLTTLNALHTR